MVEAVYVGAYVATACSVLSCCGCALFMLLINSRVEQVQLTLHTEAAAIDQLAAQAWQDIRWAKTKLGLSPGQLEVERQRWTRQAGGHQLSRLAPQQSRHSANLGRRAFIEFHKNAAGRRQRVLQDNPNNPRRYAADRPTTAPIRQQQQNYRLEQQQGGNFAQTSRFAQTGGGGGAADGACNCETDLTCPPGPPGTPGERGSAGNPGRPGRPGLEGLTGTLPDAPFSWDFPNRECFKCPPGAPGAFGSGGVPGPQGPPGGSGRPGLNGDSGPRGQQGIPGPQGDFGDGGKEGPQGRPGRPGTLGGKGIPGEDGLPGGSGTPGRIGQNGNPGQDGNLGRSGPRGTGGIPGTNGNAGLQGEPGASGRPGTDGGYCSLCNLGTGAGLTAQQLGLEEGQSPNSLTPYELLQHFYQARFSRRAPPIENNLH